MASSNLKSLVIKQDRNLTEIITDGNFRLLYNAIKEIVTYWSDLTITQSQKNAYLNKYGLTKFIDITGTIKVNNVYLAELQYICEHVNGNKYDIEGAPDGLNITPGYNLYLSVADAYMNECIVNTIYFNKITQDGVTLLDLTTAQFAWTDYALGNSDIPLCGNYVEEILPYTNTKITEENRRNWLNNLPDYYLFPDQHNISQIQIYDFTPYYQYFGDFYQKRGANNKYGIGIGWANGFGLPKLWTNIPGLAATCHPQKNIHEFWFYIPHSYSAQISMCYFVFFQEISNNSNTGILGHLTGNEVREAAKAYTDDNKRTTIDRCFMKCRGMGSNRWMNIAGYLVNIRHLYYDCMDTQRRQGGAGDREFQDPWGQPPTQVSYFILSFSCSFKPPVQFNSDEEALAWLSNPQNIRWGSEDYGKKVNDPLAFERNDCPPVYYSASDTEVMNGTKTTNDIKIPACTVYNMFAYVQGWSTWYTQPCYVPDEWYYYCKYAKHVYKFDGTGPLGRQFYNETYLHSWSDYKLFGAPYYNADTDKFWWQTNTTLNTIISKSIQNDDPHGWYAT